MIVDSSLCHVLFSFLTILSMIVVVACACAVIRHLALLLPGRNRRVHV